MVNGAGDGWAGVTVDQFGDLVLVRWLDDPADDTRRILLDGLAERFGAGQVWEQRATRHQVSPPQPVGAGGHEDGVVSEHGLQYRVRLAAGGLSAGLFLDQRENRRRLMNLALGGRTMLNCFAYTCSFSVAAARAGATVTSVDLARSYLDWGRENFQLNALDSQQHDFIYGDVFSWLKRFRKRERQWDMVILDPPTFSTSGRGRVFRAARDYEALVNLALPLVRPGGLLFCSTNRRGLAAGRFEQLVRETVAAAGRTTASATFVTQPFDFRTGPAETPYLKTVWLQLEN